MSPELSLVATTWCQTLGVTGALISPKAPDDPPAKKSNVLLLRSILSQYPTDEPLTGKFDFRMMFPIDDPPPSQSNHASSENGPVPKFKFAGFPTSTKPLSPSNWNP